MENGKEYVPPTLTKRLQDYPRLRICCTICRGTVDGYILADDGPSYVINVPGLSNAPIQRKVLNVWCHGDGLRLPIANPQELEQFRDGTEGPAFWVFIPPYEEPEPNKPKPLDLLDH